GVGARRAERGSGARGAREPHLSTNRAGKGRDRRRQSLKRRRARARESPKRRRAHGALRNASCRTRACAGYDGPVRLGRTLSAGSLVVVALALVTGAFAQPRGRAKPKPKPAVVDAGAESPPSEAPATSDAGAPASAANGADGGP